MCRLALALALVNDSLPLTAAAAADQRRLQQTAQDRRRVTALFRFQSADHNGFKSRRLNHETVLQRSAFIFFRPSLAIKPGEREAERAVMGRRGVFSLGHISEE